jgi:hypothetical protein
VAVAASALLALGVLAYVLGLWFHLWTSTDMSKHASLATIASKADSVILWEGLPHPNTEGPLYFQEVRSKATIALHGSRFYEQPLELKDQDAKRLTALFCDKGSFKQHDRHILKKCGGFHPDWCVEWRKGQEICRTLICLGCNEMKAFGPWTALHCDIKKFDQFRRVLDGYKKNRPAEGEEQGAGLPGTKVAEPSRQERSP